MDPSFPRGVAISDLLRRYIRILPLKPGDDVPVALSWDASEHEFYKAYGIGNFHEGRDFHRWMTYVVLRICLDPPLKKDLLGSSGGLN